MLFGQSDKPTELSYAQTSKTFPEIVDFKSSKNIIEEFWPIFAKTRYRGLQMRTRLKNGMAQSDVDNNMNLMNEINYNYSRTNNKGIILLPESLRTDTTPKIDSLTIYLKIIDANGNKKINFSRNDDSYLSLIPKTSWNSKLQEE